MKFQNAFYTPCTLSFPSLFYIPPPYVFLMDSQLHIIVVVRKNGVDVTIPSPLERHVFPSMFERFKHLTFPDDDDETFEIDDQVHHETCGSVADILENNHLDYCVTVKTTCKNGKVREGHINFYGQYEVE